MSTIYLSASRFLQSFLNKEGGLNTLILHQKDDKKKNVKQEYKLVAETLKYKSILDELICTCGLLKGSFKSFNSSLLLILLYEYLFGSKSITGGGTLKKHIESHKSSILSTLARIYIKKGVSKQEDLLPNELKEINQNIPRYVRVNVLLTTLENVIQTFIQEGWKCNKPQDTPEDNIYSFANNKNQNKNNNNDFSISISPDDKPANSFFVDQHIPNVLVFPPHTSFHSHHLYLDGKIILQDKASCFPAYVLSPQSNSYVIDACSAPGNKTSHLVSIMYEKNQTISGRIDAFELHQSRYELLERMMKISVPSNLPLYCHHSSFLSLQPHSKVGEKVTHILLDPTCSGSGMRHSIESYYKKIQSGPNHQMKKRKISSQQLAKEGNQYERPQKKININRETFKEEITEVEKSAIRAIDTNHHDHHNHHHNNTSSTDRNNNNNNENEIKSGTDSIDLSSLSLFQLSLLTHALSFPNLTHVVYSTCSIHMIENENVIACALRDVREKWQVENILPNWNRRGLECQGLSREETNCMIRCDKEIDKMNGFFVCLLGRKMENKGCKDQEMKRKKPTQILENEQKKREEDTKEISKSISTSTSTSLLASASSAAPFISAHRLKRKEKKRRQKARKKLFSTETRSST